MNQNFWRAVEDFMAGDCRTTAGRIASGLFWLLIGACIYLVVCSSAGYRF